MSEQQKKIAKSGIFITFAGDCKKALAFYKSCLGGELFLDLFTLALDGYKDKPVVSGSLISERITIYGSDLVPHEGKRTGNHLAVYFPCKNLSERTELARQLVTGEKGGPMKYFGEEKLLEITDIFNVRWILSL
ncbi:glyoxalase [Chryseobacterium flavum]|uniref:Glyoxalase n=1 Tax=Chryseobacterium flavum TaxID=415851 RepID=A0A3D9CV67_9FLAO|nr:glyoxalase [Chryseobacterium flavum]REC69518.1 glyoxalase [Chryseobacterium flavum]